MIFDPFDCAIQRSTPTSLLGEARKHSVVGKAVVKVGKALLIGWVLHNSSYAEQYLGFFDQAELPNGDVAADFLMTLGPGETSAMEFSMGIPFYNGLAYHQSVASVPPITGLLLFA